MRAQFTHWLTIPMLCALAIPIPAALAARPAVGPAAGAVPAASVLAERASEVAVAHSAVAVSPESSVPSDAAVVETPAVAAAPEAPVAPSAPEPAAADAPAPAAAPSAPIEAVATGSGVATAESGGNQSENSMVQGQDSRGASEPTSVNPSTAVAAGATVDVADASAATTAASPGGSSPEDYVIVELSSPAAARYEGGIKGLAATRSNGRFDVTSAAYLAYRKHLDNEHASFRSALARVAANVQVIRNYRITANAVAVQLNGASAATIARIAGAKRVYEVGLYRPTMNESVGLIDVYGAWGSPAGRTTAGTGVRVGVIDSGVPDALYAQFGLDFHPFFHCKDPELGGFFYSGETGSPAIEIKSENGNIPAPGVAWVEPHGNHVAGTIGGCVTEITEGPWSGTELSGVAPGATLVDYNVFPGIGAGFVAQDGSAFSHDIADAIETSVANGDHVINMSLGGGVQGPNDFLAQVADAAVAAGVVVVASNGNNGPDVFTNGSPGSARDVIAVGATTNTRGMGVEIRANVDGVDGDEVIKAYPGDFPNFDGSIETVIDWPGTDNLACISDVAAASLAGEVVLIARGTCTFSEKIANAKAAGAGGVIVYSDDREPGGMALTEGYDDQIPAVMVAKNDGLALEAAAVAAAQVPEPYLAEISDIILVPEVPNELADFSSRGPTRFTGLVKPDVVAPGVNILSSVFSGYELYNGTSMASPHVAGAAAILLEQNPGWTPAQVKSALATTAMDLELKPWEQGSGLIQVDKALDTNAFFAPTNASFGIFTGKAPANGVIAIAVSMDTCTVDSISGEENGVDVNASISGSTLSVSFDAGRTAPGGLYGGMVKVKCDAQTHTIPWAAVVNR